MPQISGSHPLKLKYETLQISGDFIKFSECQAPCENVIPPIEGFLAKVLIWASHHFARRFRCVRFYAIWKSKKRTNCEPSSSTSWVRFTWRVLLVCVRFSQPWWAIATWSPSCALTSLCRHTYVQCGWFYEHR